MKTWKHINLEQRKIISSGIAHNNKLIQIAESLELDPRSISKEVRRNRIPVDYPDGTISKYGIYLIIIGVIIILIDILVIIKNKLK